MTGKQPLAAVILAAGEGTRLGSGLRKPARSIQGKPLVRWVIDAVRATGADPIIVIVPPDDKDGAQVREACGPDVEFAVQEKPKGTGHALLQAKSLLSHWKSDFFTLVGDAPAVTSLLLRGLLEHHRSTGAALTFASGEYDPIPPYGRVLRDEHGSILGTIEEVDATPAQRQIREVLTSQYVFRGDLLWPLLERVRASSRSGEVQLTDVIGKAVKSGLNVEAWPCPYPERLLGINTPEEWRLMEHLLDGERG